MIDVKIELVEDGIMPEMQTKGAACFDCYARTDVAVKANAPVIIPLGFKLQIPDGYHAKLFLRSSMGVKSSLRIANSVGIIDSDYRGEVGLIAEAKSNNYHYVHKGDRIAQIMFEKNVETKLTQVDKVDTTERNTGGFGSTGER